MNKSGRKTAKLFPVCEYNSSTSHKSTLEPCKIISRMTNNFGLIIYQILIIYLDRSNFNPQNSYVLLVVFIHLPLVNFLSFSSFIYAIICYFIPFLVSNINCPLPSVSYLFSSSICSNTLLLPFPLS